MNLNKNIYNVTLKSFTKYLKENKIDLNIFPEKDFHCPIPERAVQFSSPGGFQETVLRELPKAKNSIRKIEGVHSVYEYLKHMPDMIYRGLAPLIVDCLNCELGCNGGTGTDNQKKSPDELERPIINRVKEQKAKLNKKVLFFNIDSKKEIKKLVNKYYKKDLYTRNYNNYKSKNFIDIPTENELKEVYRSMHKYSTDDLHNCASCGYNCCELMAISIFNNLNKPENCHHFMFEKIKNLEIDKMAKERQITAEEVENKKIKKYLKEIESRKNELNDYLGKTINHASSIVTTLKQMKATNSNVASMAVQLNGFAHENCHKFKNLASDIEKYSHFTKELSQNIKSITGITEKTKVLSINASIEAARSGMVGRGFSVVANEIQTLAKSSYNEIEKIKNYSNELIGAFSFIKSEINKSVDSFSETTSMIRILADATREISEATNEINIEAEKLINN